MQAGTAAVLMMLSATAIYTEPNFRPNCLVITAAIAAGVASHQLSFEENIHANPADFHAYHRDLMIQSGIAGLAGVIGRIQDSIFPNHSNRAPGPLTTFTALSFMAGNIGARIWTDLQGYPV